MNKETLKTLAALALFLLAVIAIAVWLPSVALIIIMLLQMVTIVLVYKPTFEKRMSENRTITPQPHDEDNDTES